MFNFNQQIPTPPANKVPSNLIFVTTDSQVCHVTINGIEYSASEAIIKTSKSVSQIDAARKVLDNNVRYSTLRVVEVPNVFEEAYLVPYSSGMYRKKQISFLMVVTSQGNFIVPIGVVELSTLIGTGVGVSSTFRFTGPISFWGKDTWASSSFSGKVDDYSIKANELEVGRLYRTSAGDRYLYLGDTDTSMVFLSSKKESVFGLPIYEYESIPPFTDLISNVLEISDRVRLMVRRNKGIEISITINDGIAQNYFEGCQYVRKGGQLPSLTVSENTKLSNEEVKQVMAYIDNRNGITVDKHTHVVSFDFL